MEEKFSSSSLGKNFPFGDAFSKILELTVNWQLATTAKWQKQEKKKQKSLKRLGKTFWHARTKKMSKQDATAKKGMLSCLILSSLDS